IHFCTENNWQYCRESVTSPFNCAAADNMDNIVSIAIDLNLCCRFYADDKCSISFADASPLNNEQWFPGYSQISDDLKTGMGSYECLVGNTTCPPVAATKSSVGLTPSSSSTSGLSSSSTSGLSSSSTLCLSSSSTSGLSSSPTY
ncbi:hypothetical protein K432DRAFT_310467, partial [Lepidopterella palustris CBS 459.81]